MKILVGVNPDAAGSDAMALASVLHAVFGGEVVLGHVYAHSADTAGTHTVDGEWLRYLQQDAHEIVADAAQAYGSAVQTVIHGHRSSGLGLSELGQSIGADMIVIGSAPGSTPGRFLIGSTADQLLHGSHVPVALAPAGYQQQRPAALGRLVVAFRDTPESRRALEWAVQHAEGLPLTALTVLLRHRVMGSNLAFDQEGLVVEQAREDAEAALEQTLRHLGATATTRIATGDDARSALAHVDWHGDELLVLASSRGGVLRRVFLGDMTYKLVRATSVPAVVLPRHT